MGTRLLLDDSIPAATLDHILPLSYLTFVLMSHLMPFAFFGFAVQQCHCALVLLELRLPSVPELHHIQ